MKEKLLMIGGAVALAVIGVTCETLITTKFNKEKEEAKEKFESDKKDMSDSVNKFLNAANELAEAAKDGEAIPKFTIVEE